MNAVRVYVVRHVGARLADPARLGIDGETDSNQSRRDEDCDPREGRLTVEHDNGTAASVEYTCQPDVVPEHQLLTLEEQ